MIQSRDHESDSSSERCSDSWEQRSSVTTMQVCMQQCSFHAQWTDCSCTHWNRTPHLLLTAMACHILYMRSVNCGNNNGFLEIENENNKNIGELKKR